MYDHFIGIRSVIIIFLCFAVSQAWVTGRVIDTHTNPVPDAMVAYTKLDNRLIYVYTDENGMFALPGPGEWNLKDLPMYKDPTSVIRQTVRGKKNGLLNFFDLSVAGGRLGFTVERQSRISLSVYSLRGRKVCVLCSDALDPGRYEVSLFPHGGAVMPSQPYVAVLTDGSVRESIRMIPFGRHASAGSVRMQEHGAALSKRVRVTQVDSIRAGKTDYLPAYAFVSSYSEDVGDMTIVLRDIEREIDSILYNKNKDWKAGQMSMGVDVGINRPFFGSCQMKVESRYTYQERCDWVTNAQNEAIKAGSVPQLLSTDGIHGMCAPVNGTIFPHNIGIGCSGNPELAELAERICAMECAGVGLNWDLAPCIDVVRNELHGRTYEGWDEGPGRTAVFARAAVRGFQGSDLSHPYTIAACAKHFTGAGGTIDGHTHGDCATGDYGTLCRIHLPGFRAACDAGVAAVMAAYNTFLGTEMHLHKALLTDTLKNAWGWDGFIRSDYMKSWNVGCTQSINAGVDNPSTHERPLDAYEAIKLAEDARVDDGARRMLRAKLRLNLIADPMPKRFLTPFVNCDLHRQVSRECVRRSLVLLKNNTGILPLSQNINIHIVGDHGDNMALQCGGWTLGWAGGADRYNPAGTSIKQAFDNACNGTVTYSATAGGIPAGADAIIACIGENVYVEVYGDATNLSLSGGTGSKMHGNGTAIINECVAQANGRPVIVLLFSGRPLIITNEIALVDAWVACWLPGPEGGGIADVLFNIGGEGFTGRLNHTWPATQGQIPINNGNEGDFKGSGGEPLFPYGYGLSYQ